MKLEINIEKKHLYFLSALILIVGMGAVIAPGSYDNNVFHRSLLVDYIQSKTDNLAVTVEDDLKVDGKFKGTKPFGILRFDEARDEGAVSCDNKCSAAGFANCNLAFWFDREFDCDYQSASNCNDALTDNLDCGTNFNTIAEDNDDEVVCFCDNYI